MLAVRSGLVGLAALGVLLAVLGATAGLAAAGWVAGLGCGVAVQLTVALGLLRSGHALGPADLVTLTRATLACGLAALVADALLRPPDVTPLLVLAVPALALDAVDGWIARRTRPTRFGARFDGEVDAFLILVLSVQVAGAAGGWVLAIGGARYAFAVAGWGAPWLRAQLPARYWRKVVAATQGVVLTAAMAGALPDVVMDPLLVAALVLLAESFGRDVVWLWRHRATHGAEPAGHRIPAAADLPPSPTRTVQR